MLSRRLGVLHRSEAKHWYSDTHLRFVCCAWDFCKNCNGVGVMWHVWDEHANLWWKKNVMSSLDFHPFTIQQWNGKCHFDEIFIFGCTKSCHFEGRRWCIFMLCRDTVKTADRVNSRTRCRHYTFLNVSFSFPMNILIWIVNICYTIVLFSFHTLMLQNKCTCITIIYVNISSSIFHARIENKHIRVDCFDNFRQYQPYRENGLDFNQ